MHSNKRRPRNRFTTRFAFLNPSLYYFYFVMFVVCACCLFVCESMFETLRTMFDLRVGGKQAVFA